MRGVSRHISNPPQSSRGHLLLLAMTMVWTGGLLPMPELAAWQSDKVFPGELAGLDQSDALLIDDDQPVSAQQEFLVRLLYRARKATPASLQSFAAYSESVTLPELMRAPKQYRGWVFRLSGRAKSAEWVSTGEKGADVLGRFCRVRMVTESGQEVVVYSVQAPLAWTQGQARSGTLDEPCAVFGFFAVRPRDAAGEIANPVFIARRIEWYPAANASLTSRGFDSGLLDLATKHNLRDFSEEESEAFYGMLAASGKELTPGESEAPRAGFLELLATPQQMIGAPVEFEATVRRVVPVTVDSRQGLAGDRFFQVDAFYRLGDTPVEVRGASGETIRYQTRFPVTINSVRLPGEPAALAGERIRIRGWLYRFWKYDSEFTEQQAAGAGQLAPLVMASQIEVLPEVGSGTVARLAYLAIAAAVMSIGFSWWVTRRRVPGRPERPPLPERIDL